MSRIAWLTDLHLNFVDDAKRDKFYETLKAQSPDAMIVSGDFGESTNVVDFLIEMDNYLERPLYFVLGNHDFYHGSIAEVRGGASLTSRSQAARSWSHSRALFSRTCQCPDL
jgi:predicted MPP superfamily phosphohydrolase